MCPSLAELDSSGFPKSKVSNHEPQANKSFLIQQFFKNAGEVWASSPHLRSKSFCNLFSLLQLQFLKLANSKLAIFYETSCKFGQGNGAIAARWQAKAGVEPPFVGRERPFSLRRICLRKTNCVRFGRIALLSACMLFASGCVVRIAYVSFLDYNLQEVSLFLRWRTAFFLVFLRFLSMLIVHSLQGAACPLFRGCPAPLSLRDISPHCGESPSPS